MHYCLSKPSNAPLSRSICIELKNNAVGEVSLGSCREAFMSSLGWGDDAGYGIQVHRLLKLHNMPDRQLRGLREMGPHGK